MNTPIGLKTNYGYEFYLKRNCSISPILLAVIFMFLGTVSVLIGTIFFLLGATLILPFSFIEVLALVVAYFYIALHANDFERLRVDNENVYFESKFGSRFLEEKFLRSMTRILPSDRKNLINLCHGQRNILFGHNIHMNSRSILEKEIKQALQILE
ncbi:MAG: DUF2244 domain-containing protein [Betaproteobacteria bacterium]